MYNPKFPFWIAFLYWTVGSLIASPIVVIIWSPFSSQFTPAEAIEFIRSRLFLEDILAHWAVITLGLSSGKLLIELFSGR